jgi:hypothetical protein
MVKTIVTVLAIALTGTASAAGWRDLSVDGTSEEAFAKSLEAFKDKLPPAHRYVFGEALKDIWVQGWKAAEAEQREYTAEAYYAQVDGLGYDEVVTLTDPTGHTAKVRYETAIRRYVRAPAPNHVIPGDYRDQLRSNGLYPRPDGPGHRG